MKQAWLLEARTETAPWKNWELNRPIVLRQVVVAEDEASAREFAARARQNEGAEAWRSAEFSRATPLSVLLPGVVVKHTEWSRG